MKMYFDSIGTMRKYTITASTSWARSTYAYDWSLVLLFTVSSLGVDAVARGMRCCYVTC